MSRNRLEKYLPRNKSARMLVLMLMDICMICLASFLGLFIRFDMNIGRIPIEYIQVVLMYLPIHVIVTIAIFFWFQMYTTMWRNQGGWICRRSLWPGVTDANCWNDFIRF